MRCIGSANYDVGHALGTAGGGIAYIGVACSSAYKGGGVSGAGAADNPYTVMVTAHELGHQFGAHHTFNATSGACGGGNRSAANAFEPGSGSTIMSYSGLCGAEQNLGGFFTTFHVASFGQIYDYSRNRNGASCGVALPTGNHAPVVEGGGDFVIPPRTPFVLTGSASDPDGQPLTYSWQQVDVLAAPYTGTATLQQALTDLGSGALYRVAQFSTQGAGRAFPAWANVLAGTVELGEVYATTNRSLNFRLFARDNQAAGGGANYDSVRLTVVDSGSAFRVTAPAAGAAWPAGLGASGGVGYGEHKRGARWLRQRRDFAVARRGRYVPQRARRGHGQRRQRMGSSAGRAYASTRASWSAAPATSFTTSPPPLACGPFPAAGRWRGPCWGATACPWRGHRWRSTAPTR